MSSLHVMRGAAILLASSLGASVIADEAVGPRSVWAGVYTAEQAARGAEAYPGPCGRCHGFRLDGAPDDPDMLPTRPIAGRKFLRDWDGRSLASLLEYLRLTMPENNPGYLSEREYVDLIAFMLFESGIPPGQSELTPNRATLSPIVIRRQP